MIKSELYCSFCGKSQHEVKQLIAAIRHFICDECVDILHEIVEKKRSKPDPAIMDRLKRWSGGVTLETIYSELTALRSEFAAVRADISNIKIIVDGLPLLHRTINVMHRDARSLRAAFNDFARTNVTAGEIEALHTDVNRVQAENAELTTRIATLERLIDELRHS